MKLSYEMCGDPYCAIRATVPDLVGMWICAKCGARGATGTIMIREYSTSGGGGYMSQGGGGSGGYTGSYAPTPGVQQIEIRGRGGEPPERK